MIDALLNALGFLTILPIRSKKKYALKIWANQPAGSLTSAH
jgi:hypothetical protein